MNKIINLFKVILLVVSMAIIGYSFIKDITIKEFFHEALNPIVKTYKAFRGTPRIYSGQKRKNKANSIKIDFIWPILHKKGRLSESFGIRWHPIHKKKMHHHGIDIAAPKNTKVIASMDGTVEEVGYSKSYGNFILINHGNGYSSMYAHLTGYKGLKGQRVKQGEVIGYVGSTGISTGNHLHFEVREHNKKLDPLPLVMK